MKLKLFDNSYLNLVEFNITGDNQDYKTFDSESKFLESEVFNLFTTCFENSNKLFDYYGTTKYNVKKIIPLLNELKKNLNILKHINTFDKFYHHIDLKILGLNFLAQLEKDNHQWKNNWRDYLEKLIEINKDLIKLVSRCINEDKILWVKGY
jgi:hypothetical protein